MAELSELRQFAGAPKDFWLRFLNAAAKLAAADAAVLLLGNPAKEPRWSRIGDWNSDTAPSKGRTDFASRIPLIAERCLSGGNFVE